MGLNMSAGEICVQSPVVLGYVEITDILTPAASVDKVLGYSTAQ
jgi:hypothetical protein